MYDEFDNKENEDRYDPKQPSAEDEVKTGKKISCQKPKRYRHRQRKKPKHPQNPGSSHLFTITATKEANRQSRQAAHRTHSSMVHQSIMQKSILTKKRKDTVSTIRMASITREKTDGMTAFTKIIRSRNIRWKAAGKSRLAQARRSQLLSDVQLYSVWCLE